jgi:hypothetical protein
MLYRINKRVFFLTIGKNNFKVIIDFEYQNQSLLVLFQTEVLLVQEYVILILIIFF